MAIELTAGHRTLLDEVTRLLGQPPSPTSPDEVEGAKRKKKLLDTLERQRELAAREHRQGANMGIHIDVFRVLGYPQVGCFTLFGSRAHVKAPISPREGCVCVCIAARPVHTSKRHHCTILAHSVYALPHAQPEPVHGHVPGVKPGDLFNGRPALVVTNVHATGMKGIHAP